jgi:virulence-associated protein VapD
MHLKIMFAIAFDLHGESLKSSYGKPSWNNAYNEVREFLAGKGFTQKQGSLYYGDETVDQVKAVLAVVELSKAFPYLKHSVTDIRILQLLANDDLMPAVLTGNPD